MKYIKLCDMNLSQIVLGTDRFGTSTDKKTAFELMDFYIGNGGNVLDTARMYGDGKSEELLGEYIKGIRDKVFISTKCSHPYDMSVSRLSKEEIVYDLELSLKTLKVDYVDILWLHRDDTLKPVEPVIDTLNELKKQGKIRAFGASNWSHDRIMQANEYAKKSGQSGFCASQALYNMAKCNSIWDHTLAIIDDAEKGKYDKSRLPVFAFCSQAKGFFEKYHQGTLSEKAAARYLNDETLKRYELIKERAERDNTTISYAALKMLAEQSSFDVFPIIGPSNITQLKDSLNCIQ